MNRRNLRRMILLLATAVAIILMLSSCMCKGMPDDAVTVTTNFYVTDVYVGKYSKVKGYIIYKDIKIPADNGGSGYYSLTEGSVVPVTISIAIENDGYNSVTLRTSALDLTKYIQ